MEFDVFGPYEIPRNENGSRVRHEDLPEFWEQIEEETPGISSATGVYIFLMKASKGHKVWYVGQARGQIFEKECFADHKLKKYNQIIADRRGTPLLMLLARKTPKGKFTKTSGKPIGSIDFLEDHLIGLAHHQNSELLNFKNVKMYRELVVPGLFNSPRGVARKAPVQLLRKLLGQS